MKPRRSFASRLKDRIRIERPVADDDFDGAGSETWPALENDVAAEIVDELPSRDERLVNGFMATSRRSRVRLRYRTDVTPDMRFVEIVADAAGNDIDGRTMQIIGGPAQLGREGVEYMVEEIGPARSSA